MAKCNDNPIVFPSLGRRNVMADFKGGTLSSDGGTILLREADRRLQLRERIDAVIPDRRNQDLIIHSQGSMPRAETSNDPISAAGGGGGGGAGVSVIDGGSTFILLVAQEMAVLAADLVLTEA